MRNQKKLRGNRSIYTASIEACEQRLLMSTYTVNTTSDAANANAGLLTLRQAVAKADAGSTASTVSFSSSVFGPGAAHTITLAQGQLQVSGNTSIVVPAGDNLTIDANHTGRVFQISTGSTVVLQNMTITNGLVATAPGVAAVGGAILNYGALILRGDTISSSNASGGSFIYAGGADQQGIGGEADGGGVYSTGPLTVAGSTISGNTAQGGSSYSNYFTGPVTNVAKGGGIYDSEYLSITGSVITQNSAIGGVGDGGQSGGAAFGGGVYASGSADVAGTVSDDSALGGHGVYNDGSMDSGANASGGGLYLSGNATISALNLNGNLARGGDTSGGGGSAGVGSGGAIFASGAVTMNASTINGNFAEGGGGPFDDNGPGGAGEGGGVTATAAFNVSGSTISNNTATGGSGQPDRAQAKGSGYGGGFYSTSLLNVVASTLSGNIAQADQAGAPFDTYGGAGGDGQGGAIYFSGYATLTNSTLSGNIARGGVGDLAYEGGLGGDGGNGAGGGVFNEYGMLTITNSTLADNSAQGGAGAAGGYNGGNGGDGGGGLGGAIDSQGSSEIFDSTISGNTTTGGAPGPVGLNGDNNYLPGTPGRALGAGVIAAGSFAIVENTIISGNQDAGSVEDDVVGNTNDSVGDSSFATQSDLIGIGGGLTNGVDGNVVGVDNPLLAPLGNYGGPTQTMPPLVNSPALNAGANNAIPAGVTTDQRGDARITGGRIDIGAVELQLGSVSGNVFNDLNGDGVQQTGDTGLANITVYADLSNSGVYRTGDPIAVTNSSGNYTLAGVPEGAVIIRQYIPTGYRQSYPIGGSGEHVNVTPANVTGALFADSTTLYVSGTVKLNGASQGGVIVYADLNNDGQFDNRENNKTTAADGSFAFVSLAAGTYTFRIVTPAGETFNGNSAITVTMSSGGVDTDLNFTLTAQPTTQLTGTVIGTAGSYKNQGNTAAKAFDGNLNTFFDAPTASGSYAGLDLGSSQVVTQISYAPRSGWASRMVGGMFQGSNSANFTGSVTLYTIASTPVTGSLTTVTINNSTSYRYLRYLGPANSYCDVAEIEFFGPSSPAGAAKLNSAGQLQINGSAAADDISINLFASNSLVNVIVNGTQQSFTWSSVKSIFVNSGDGNDTISVSGTDNSSLDLPAISITSGNGNDTFTAALNADASNDSAVAMLSIIAGNGNDIFQVNGSSTHATVTAGNGNDTFSTTTLAGTDDLYATITAGDGNDAITTGNSGATGSQYVVFNAGIGNDTVITTDEDNYTSGIIAGQAYSLITSEQEILGKVYSDTNKDGIYQNGEPLVGNYPVSFRNAFDGTFGTTTDSTGNYLVHVTFDPSNGVVSTYGPENSVSLDGHDNQGELISGANFVLPTPLTGTVIGTAGSYQNDGNSIAKAFDGNLTTYFDGPTANGNYLGQDLGSAQVITAIAYAPRSGWASRMVGGVFQGANTANFSDAVNLYTVTSIPQTGVLTYVPLGNTTAFRYVRYLSPAGSFGDLAEVQFFDAQMPAVAASTVGAAFAQTGKDVFSSVFFTDKAFFADLN